MEHIKKYWLVYVILGLILYFLFFNKSTKIFAVGGRIPGGGGRPAPTPIPSRPVIIPRPVNPNQPSNLQYKNCGDSADWYDDAGHHSAVCTCSNGQVGCIFPS